MNKQGYKSIKHAQRLIDRERNRIGVGVATPTIPISNYPSPHNSTSILKPNAWELGISNYNDSSFSKE